MGRPAYGVKGITLDADPEELIDHAARPDGDRRLLAQKAPAKGLTLLRVEYPKEEEGD